MVKDMDIINPASNHNETLGIILCMRQANERRRYTVTEIDP